MKQVRKDVQDKLIKGLNNKRLEADKVGATLPKNYQYSTRKAVHHIHMDGEFIHFNSTLYDGTKCYSKIRM